jgi:hypothetical protein
MTQPIHILYIPGLGDKYDPFRIRLISWWHYRDITTEVVPMTWADGAPYDEKFSRLSAAIDRAAGKRIVLIGESAGGSMVVNMYAARANDLYKIMTFCGKNTHPENVSPHLYRVNPAFKTSMQRTHESVAALTEQQRREFISVVPLYDPVVPVAQTMLEGCKRIRLFSFGHFVPIIQALTLSSWRIVREIKH